MDQVPACGYASGSSGPPVNAVPIASSLSLEFDSVTKVYGGQGDGVVALCDVTVGLARGSVVALLGGPGAGKSTFVACATGRERPTTGLVIRPDPGVEALTAAADSCRVTSARLVIADGLAGAPGQLRFERLRAVVRATGGTLLIATSDPLVASGADVVLFLVGGRLVDAMAGVRARRLARHLAQLSAC